MPKKKPEIAYLSSEDPRNIHAWSGIHYSIFNAASKHLGNVTAFGPYTPHLTIKIIKIIQLLYKIFSGKKYNRYHSPLLSKAYAKYFNKKINEKKYDFILAVSASAELAYLSTDIPVVYIADALFACSLNYYPTLSNLCKQSVTEGNELEKKALLKSSLVCLPSSWAAQSAQTDYQIKSEKIAVIPMGANLLDIPDSENILNNKLNRTKTTLNLIFVGVNWENKGGSVARECLLHILESGQNAVLTVVGCPVPEELKHPNIINYPFIKKNSVEGQSKFRELYSEADFLILPTRFEAYGIVFCEAAAYGVISITYNTGGTTTSVKENGCLLPPGSSGKEFARLILEIYNNKELFMSGQIAARYRFDKELNWDSWALNLKDKLKANNILF